MFYLISPNVKFLFQSLILINYCLVIPERYLVFFQIYNFTLQGSQYHHIAFYFYMNSATIKHTPKLLLEI